MNNILKDGTLEGKLLALQPSQPLLGVLKLGDTGLRLSRGTGILTNARWNSSQHFCWIYWSL
jgi:hypothetical protein